MEGGISFDKKTTAKKSPNESFAAPVDISLEDLQNDKLDEIFNNGESVEYGISPEKQSAVDTLYAKYPKIKSIIESAESADIKTDVDEAVAEELATKDMQQRLIEESNRRKSVAERNIRNFVAIINEIARREMLDPKHVRIVVDAKVAELSDEANNLASMMEDPRIILDKIVPEAVEQIKALEEMDGHATH